MVKEGAEEDTNCISCPGEWSRHSRTCKNDRDRFILLLCSRDLMLLVLFSFATNSTHFVFSSAQFTSLYTMVLISIPATASGNAPASTFATCCDTRSTIMLEFQGIIEMDGATWAGNQLGQLSIMDGVCIHTSLPRVPERRSRKEQSTYFWYILPYLGR